MAGPVWASLSAFSLFITEGCGVGRRTLSGGDTDRLTLVSILLFDAAARDGQCSGADREPHGERARALAARTDRGDDRRGRGLLLAHIRGTHHRVCWMRHLRDVSQHVFYGSTGGADAGQPQAVRRMLYVGQLALDGQHALPRRPKAPIQESLFKHAPRAAHGRVHPDDDLHTLGRLCAGPLLLRAISPHHYLPRPPNTCPGLVCLELHTIRNSRPQALCAMVLAGLKNSVCPRAAAGWTGLMSR